MCSSGFLFYVDSKGDVLQNALPLTKARDGRRPPDRLNFSGLRPCLLLHVVVLSLVLRF